MSCSAYEVLTNNDLLFEITKWHIFDYYNDHKKFINIISKDKNINKLVWLINNNYVTINQLNEMTVNLTSMFTGIFNKLSFFDYTYFAGSTNIIEYLSPEIDLKHMDMITYVNNMFENTSDSSNMFKNVQYNSEIFNNFISFYNYLPQNNLFDNIFKIINPPNIELLLSELNPSQKEIQIYNGNFNLDNQRPVINHKDEIIKFLLKSNFATLEQLDLVYNCFDTNDITIGKTIMYAISNNLCETVEYIVYKYPIENDKLKKSLMFENDALHEHLYKNSFETYMLLLQYNPKFINEKPINLLLNYALVTKNNNQAKMKYNSLFNLIKKTNMFPILTNCIEKGNLKEIMEMKKICAYIKSIKSELNNELLNCLSICHSDNFVEQFRKLPVDMKKQCAKYLQCNNNMALLGKIVLNKDIKIEFNTKIFLLLQNNLYREAINDICYPDDELKYINSQTLSKTYESHINYAFNKCYILTNIQPLLNHIYLNENDYDIVSFFKILVTKIGLDDKLQFANDLPKKLNNFHEIFSIICNSITYVNEAIEYCERLFAIQKMPLGNSRIGNNPLDVVLDGGAAARRNEEEENIRAALVKPNFVELINGEIQKNINIVKFVNEYNLSNQLDKFINSDNYLIQNIVAQNMLNKGNVGNKICVEFKMINMTSNIYKKNVKNINYVANNLVKRDHNLLVIMYNYSKTLPDCHDMTFNDFKIFLNHIQKNVLNDDIIFNNFSLDKFIYEGDDKNYFLNYFISSGMCKCLDLFLNINKDIKYDRYHVKLAKCNDAKDVLIKHKNLYTITPLKPIKL